MGSGCGWCLQLRPPGLRPKADFGLEIISLLRPNLWSDKIVTQTHFRFCRRDTPVEVAAIHTSGRDLLVLGHQVNQMNATRYFQTAFLKNAPEIMPTITVGSAQAIQSSRCTPGGR